MKARIKWVEDRTFVGESGSGHKIVLGTPFRPEGRSPGPSPMELVLIGLGGCSGYDVVHILEKGRQAIEDVAVELEAERAQQDPKVFTRIHMHFVVKGRGLAVEKVERAIALSAEKYCSASAMIAKSATITHDFEVVDTTATATAGKDERSCPRLMGGNPMQPLPPQLELPEGDRFTLPTVSAVRELVPPGGQLPAHMVLKMICGKNSGCP